jgi:hypothetical protein
MEEKEFEFKIRLERVKCSIDYVKHLTTLSTGALILVSAFSEKLFPHPRYGFLITLMVIGFLAAILGAVTIHTLLLASFPPRKSQTPWEEKLMGFCTTVAWLGFLGGCISLGVFAWANVSN